MTADWIRVAILFALLMWVLWIYIPYGLRYFRRKNWPSADAAIQSSTIGKISSKNSCLPACFVGYGFKVQEERFGGYFVLTGKEDSLEELRKNLRGISLQVRYDPSDPNISLLSDYRDTRFAGLKASQDPRWLNQAPPPDLEDALRG